ncbi:MAG: 50S ribosomal protein L9 [Pseudomonadota bacterium]
MQVILLEKIENLGSIGDKVTVKPGYGRNFLLPQGKATLATKANLAAFEARRAELEQKAANELAAAERRADSVRDIQLEIAAKAGSEGKLFGSVGTIDIANAFAERGVEIERAEIRLPDDGPIREAGDYTIALHLHSDVDVDVALAVVAEE